MIKFRSQLVSIVVDKRLTTLRCLSVVENEVNNQLERGGDCMEVISELGGGGAPITCIEHLLLLISLIIHATSTCATAEWGTEAGNTLVPCLRASTTAVLLPLGWWPVCLSSTRDLSTGDSVVPRLLYGRANDLLMSVAHYAMQRRLVCRKKNSTQDSFALSTYFKLLKHCKQDAAIISL